MIKLVVRGPGTADLARYLQENYQWMIQYFAQTSYFGGYIIGTHPTPDDFIGVGINDGSYVKSIEEYDASEDHPALS